MLMLVSRRNDYALPGSSHLFLMSRGTNNFGGGKNCCTQLIERENEKKNDYDKYSSMSNVEDDLLPNMYLCGGIKREKGAKI